MGTPLGTVESSTPSASIYCCDSAYTEMKDTSTTSMGNDTNGTVVTTDCTISISENSASSPASSTYGCISPTFALESCFPMDLDVKSTFGSRYDEVIQDVEGENMSIERLQTISRDSRSNLMDLTVSRTGRELQRYGYASVADGDNSRSNTNGVDSGTPNCRLVTGSIPILADGRILLISSTKSRDVFVLPKGGWEQDESLPVAALRETLEEAGVTGILGPPLPPLTYETKKSKSHRASGSRPVDSACDAGISDNDAMKTSTSQGQTTVAAAGQSNRDLHTHNRLIIFPLYVQSIYDHWPEENRVRRSVSMDEAIALLEHRPEFLLMVHALRDQSLHMRSTFSAT